LFIILSYTLINNEQNSAAASVKISDKQPNRTDDTTIHKITSVKRDFFLKYFLK